jgi:Bacteriophage head to tail connecting protein
MYDRESALKRHAELVDERRREEPAWRELAEFCRPDDTSFDGEEREREDAEIYDSTPLIAADTFAGGIYGQMTNPVNRWMELTLDDEDRAKYKPVADYLYRLGNVLYSSLSPQMSAFYTEMPSVFANLGVFGNGYLSQEEIPGEGISDRSLPIGQCYVALDYKGDLAEFQRAFPLNGRQVKQKFPELHEKDVDDAGRYRVVHQVARNPDYKPSRIGQNAQPWHSCYFAQDIRALWREGGFYECPYHVFHWNRRDGRPYATGQGHNARADMGTLNETERSNVVSAAFTAEPPLLTTSETAITAADVIPNAVLEGALNEQGKQLLQILERKSQLQPNLAQSEQRRNAIRAAFYYSLMQLMQRPQMTATEFLGFQEELLKLMAPNLVRVQAGLSSFIVRRFRILQRAGQIDAILGPPPPEMQGRIEIRYVSPLAKVQKSSTARNILGFVDAMAKVALAKQDPGVMDNVDGDACAPHLRVAFTEIPDVLTDPKKRDALRTARAKQQAMPAQMEMMGKGAEIAATVSHAMQAKTLADGRGGKAA